MSCDRQLLCICMKKLHLDKAVGYNNVADELIYSHPIFIDKLTSFVSIFFKLKHSFNRFRYCMGTSIPLLKNEKDVKTYSNNYIEGQDSRFNRAFVQPNLCNNNLNFVNKVIYLAEHLT